MALLELQDYDISADRGFLCDYNADLIALSGASATARKIAMALPSILPSGRVRQYLKDNLPGHANEQEWQKEISPLDDHQARMLMVHYSFMVQAYVWGEDEAPEILPEKLAVPMCCLAERLGQQPLLPYSGYVLDNWAKLNNDGDVDLDNIYMIQNFLGGQDENWFVLIHVAIEARAGECLALMKPIVEAIENNDTDSVTDCLNKMAPVWGDIIDIFKRMPERCDPYVYFERVRPYIHGWRDNPALPNGIIYEGVAKYAGKPQTFRGQTGSQSSIVPTMDALLGIGHAADPLKTFLDQLHIYRPPSHRRFIDDVRQTSKLREFVKSTGNAAMTDGYNHLVQAVSDFRTQHLLYAANYINKQKRGAAGNDTEVGTGGTPFMKYLKKHRDETSNNLLPH